MGDIVRSDRCESPCSEDYPGLTQSQWGCRAGAQLVPLVTLLTELYKSVPRFSTDKGHFRLRYPNEKRVQEPLEDVYDLFISSHLFILNYLKKRDTSESILRVRFSKDVAH